MSRNKIARHFFTRGPHAEGKVSVVPDFVEFINGVGGGMTSRYSRLAEIKNFVCLIR